MGAEGEQKIELRNTTQGLQVCPVYYLSEGFKAHHKVFMELNTAGHTVSHLHISLSSDIAYSEVIAMWCQQSTGLQSGKHCKIPDFGRRL